ncbi:MAG: hypothetical protein WAM53_17245 [Terrimicrobiaceae bacterium]
MARNSLDNHLSHLHRYHRLGGFRNLRKRGSSVECHNIDPTVDVNYQSIVSGA